MVTTMMYGKAERLRSYELLAREWGLSVPTEENGDGRSSSSVKRA
jgi:hypothetical protein